MLSLRRVIEVAPNGSAKVVFDTPREYRIKKELEADRKERFQNASPAYKEFLRKMGRA